MSYEVLCGVIEMYIMLMLSCKVLHIWFVIANADRCLLDLLGSFGRSLYKRAIFS